MKRLTDDQVAATLPGGLRCRVMVEGQRHSLETAHLSPGGRSLANQFNCAKLGIPWDAEQDARWRKLGIHPDQET